MARRLARVAVLGSVVAATVLAGAAAATAAPAAPAATKAGDCSQVYLGPQTTPTSTANYFTLDAAPGQRLRAQLVAANPTTSTCVVDLARGYGNTATNSGDTYVAVGRGGSCAGAACWLSDVPTSVTLSPGSRLLVPFSVRAPADATAGQYLAGIIGSPGSSAASDGSDGSGVRVKVRTRVAIGVAITVAGPLAPHLSIPSVTVNAHQSTTSAGVAISEVNGGNTWEHPAGTLTVSISGRKVSVPVKSDTVLAGGRAVLQIGTSNVPRGTHPSRVELWYAGHRKVAVWQGALTFPAPPTVTRQGDHLVLSAAPTAHSIPLWVYVVTGAAGLLLLLVLALLLLLWKRRRRDNGDDNTDIGNTSTGRHRAEPAPV